MQKLTELKEETDNYTIILETSNRQPDQWNRIGSPDIYPNINGNLKCGKSIILNHWSKDKSLIKVWENPSAILKK